MPPSITQTVFGLAAAYVVGSWTKSLLSNILGSDSEPWAHEEMLSERTLSEWEEEDREVWAWVEATVKKSRDTRTRVPYTSRSYPARETSNFGRSESNTIQDMAYFHDRHPLYNEIPAFENLHAGTSPYFETSIHARDRTEPNVRGYQPSSVRNIPTNDNIAPPPYSLKSSTSTSTTPACTCCIPPSGEDFADSWTEEDEDDWIEDEDEDEDEVRGWTGYDNEYTGIPYTYGPGCAPDPASSSSHSVWQSHNTNSNSRPSAIPRQLSMDQILEESQQKYADIDRRFAYAESYRPLTYKEKELKIKLREDVKKEEILQINRLVTESSQVKAAASPARTEHLNRNTEIPPISLARKMQLMSLVLERETKPATTSSQISSDWSRMKETTSESPNASRKSLHTPPGALRSTNDAANAAGAKEPLQKKSVTSGWSRVLLTSPNASKPVHTPPGTFQPGSEEGAAKAPLQSGINSSTSTSASTSHAYTPASSEEDRSGNTEMRKRNSIKLSTQTKTKNHQLSPLPPSPSINQSKPVYTPPETFQPRKEEERTAKAARAKELLNKRQLNRAAQTVSGDQSSFTRPYANKAPAAEPRNTKASNPTAEEFQSRRYLIPAKRESGLKIGVDDVNTSSGSSVSGKALETGLNRNTISQRDEPAVQHADDITTVNNVKSRSWSIRSSEPSKTSNWSMESLGRGPYIPPAKRALSQDMGVAVTSSHNTNPHQSLVQSTTSVNKQMNDTSHLGSQIGNAIAVESIATVDHISPSKTPSHSEVAPASYIPPPSTPTIPSAPFGVDPHYALVLEAAQATVTALDKIGVKCALFGSLAANLYGAERIPKDVDLLTFPTTEKPMDPEQIKDYIVSVDSRFYLKKSVNPKNDYRILWFNPRNEITSTNDECKVDILIPGIMGLPDLVGDDEAVRWLMPDQIPHSATGAEISLPVLPFPVVLLHKLQGWADHRVAREHFKRKRQGQDAADVASLLSIHAETDYLVSQMSYASPSLLNPDLWIPALMALWTNPIWFPVHFQKASKRRVRLFCYYFPEWKSHWEQLGFESEPYEGEVEREKKQVVLVGGGPGDTSEWVQDKKVYMISSK